MTSPAVSVKDLLVAASIGVAGGSADWAIYVGSMPEKPDRMVAVTDSGGRGNWTKWLLDFPSIQIRVRGRKGDYNTARGKLVDCETAILGLEPQVVNSDRIVSITALGGLAFLGYDANERPEFVYNFNMIIEPAAPAGSHRIAL